LNSRTTRDGSVAARSWAALPITNPPSSARNTTDATVVPCPRDTGSTRPSLATAAAV
jgi:hypothetical protein